MNAPTTKPTKESKDTEVKTTKATEGTAGSAAYSTERQSKHNQETNEEDALSQEERKSGETEDDGDDETTIREDARAVNPTQKGATGAIPKIRPATLPWAWAHGSEDEESDSSRNDASPYPLTQGRETAQTLRRLGSEIMEIYGASGNLRRAAKEEANDRITRIGRALRGGEDPEMLAEWRTEIHGVISSISASRGFSKALTANMEEKVREGCKSINRLYMQDSSKRPGQQPQETTRTQTTTKTRTDDSSTEEEQVEENPWTEAHATKGKKRKRNAGSPKENTETQERVTPPAKRPPDPEAAKGADEKSDQVPQTRPTTRSRPTIRVRARDKETFAQLLQEVRRRTPTDGLQVKGVRKAAANSDALIETLNHNQAEELCRRIVEWGGTAEVLGPPKTRIHLRNLHDPTEPEEIAAAVAQTTEEEEGKIVFLIPGRPGTITCFVDLSSGGATKCRGAGKIRIGWADCPVDSLHREQVATDAGP